MPHTLITGAAGFIGFHLAKRLVEQGHKVTGIDNLNTYYDVQLKRDRLQQLGIDTRGQSFTQQERATSEKHPNFKFLQLDLCDEEELNDLFEASGFEMVINLAAQAGVRYSLKNPKAYINSNIVGFANLLEACRHHPVDHLIYASSSSVYGNRERTPFKESDNVDEPVSLYAATKKSNELLAYTYSHLYNLPTTGLRFFTVYGPWGRPDMAAFLFAKSILEEEPIKVFNHGNLMRDFTYIDDIVTGIQKIIQKPAVSGQYKLYNIGNSNPVKLLDFIETLEQHLGKKAKKQMYPMQDGDVYKTYASVEKLKNAVGYEPATDLDEGIRRFVIWYKKYYGYH